MNIGHFGRLSQALPPSRPIEQRKMTLFYYLTEVITLSVAVKFEFFASKYLIVWRESQPPPPG